MQGIHVCELGVHVPHREVVGDVGSEEEGTVRIPLRAVIRFKERQWFAEELQVISALVRVF